MRSLVWPYQEEKSKYFLKRQRKAILTKKKRSTYKMMGDPNSQRIESDMQEEKTRDKKIERIFKLLSIVLKLDT